jgi:hypothetical protein
VSRRVRCAPAVLLAGALAVVGASAPAGTVAERAGAAPARVRALPYPFAHLVTVISDVDMQAPWHGAAIHRVINEEIGLPLSDSLWVQGSSMAASSLFVGPTEPNRRPSGVPGHTTAGLLLRQWHRGNIDHLHSWQDDGAAVLRKAFPQPVRLAAAATRVTLESPPKILASFYFQHLRLVFSAPPPPDLSLVLEDGSGRRTTVGVDAVRAGRAVKLDPSVPPYMTDVIVGTLPDVGVTATREQLDPFGIVAVELHASSCASGCSAALERIDRDGFSRRTVALQLPWLEAHGMRPAILTSHGGWTLAHDYGLPGFKFVMPRTVGSVFEDPMVPNELSPLANDPTQHAYQTDLLRRLGVLAVWSYGDKSRNNFQYYWKEGRPASRSSYAGLYDLYRTAVEDWDTSTVGTFRESLWHMEPLLRSFPVARSYCRSNCGGDQGSMLGLLLGLSFTRIDAGLPTEHLWSTHFASGDGDFKPSVARPVKPEVEAQLRRLAEYYYGFDPHIGARRRVWVAPAGSAARYGFLQPQVAREARVDAARSRVTVPSWTDPVTGRTVPDPVVPQRDLQGITVYVPDAMRASASVAGRETLSFTRNPPDETGSPSITFVDDTAPTVVVGRVPLGEGGRVLVAGGRWDESGPRPGAAQVPIGRGVLTAAADGAALVRWNPSELELRNVGHLRIAYRKHGDGAGAGEGPGRFFVLLRLADGGDVLAAEDPQALAADRASSWRLDPGPSADGWHVVVLPVAGLRWPRTVSGRPPLPLGRVREVQFGLTGPAAGERLELAEISALRPDGTAAPPDDRKLVAGQVRRADGQPAAHTPVELTTLGGPSLETLTDESGYYAFPGQPSGAIVRLAAAAGGGRCYPARGRWVEIRKDEAELDINLGACRPNAR